MCGTEEYGICSRIAGDKDPLDPPPLYPEMILSME